MNNYLLLGTCFLLGILLRYLGRLPNNAAAALNGFVVHISLPALTLTYVHGLKLDISLILPALMAWVMFGIGCGFFWLVSKAIGFSRPTTGALILTGGARQHLVRRPANDRDVLWSAVSRTRNINRSVGFLFRGLSTVGILVASLYSPGREVTAEAVFRRIVLFVPFQAFVVALLLMPFEYPSWLDELLKRLGATLVPIALVSVGYQLQLSHVRGKAHALAMENTFKLVIGPAIILILYAGLLRADWPILSVTVFEAAMGPMIGASIVAMDHELDPPLVTLMVEWACRFRLTLPAWWYLLSVL